MSTCANCRGDVRNVPGKRHTIEQLFTIHDESCPAAGRRRKRTEAEVAVEPMQGVKP